ncbi:MAG: BatA domain-containing protein [Phycisphaerae bacterium]|nr:BatA domain-containing protein [Phycisphaerae bacterium]
METLLAALSLLSPWMLAGAGLVALPIVAHLLSRHVRRRVVFPTVRLLRQSRARTARLFRLRRWLVLLLRCLAVCLIAAAFARPVWSRHPAPSADEAGGAVVLIVDVSASMGQRQEGTELFEAARALADRALNALEPGTDRVGLVCAGARARAAMPELTADREAVRRELKRLEPTQQTADVPAALGCAARLLRQHPGPHRLAIFTDLQERNWSGLATACEALPAETVITLVPVGDEPVANVGLSRPRCAPARPLVDRPAALRVQVSNYSPRPRDVEVVATVDGEPVGAQTVALKPWISREVSFPVTLDRAGLHTAVLAIGTDGLAVDNHAYLALETIRRLKVAVVADDNPNEPGTSSYFLTRALAPRGDPSDALMVRSLEGQALAYDRLADVDAVFVGRVGELNPDRLEGLATYVHRGGGAALFCGDGPVRPTLEALADNGEVDVPLPWMPQEPRDLEPIGGFLRFDRQTWNDTVLPGFDDDCRDALCDVRIFHAWKTEALRSGAEDVLRYTDGTPALSCRHVGAGRLVLCNFSPSLRCSSLGKYGGFVAMMHALTDYLRPDESFAEFPPAGEALVVPIDDSDERRDAGAGAPSSDDLTVVGPDGRPCEHARLSGRVVECVRVARAGLPGFYEVRRGEHLIARAGVNVSPVESDLRRLDADVLGEALAGSQKHLSVHETRATGPLVEMRGRPLWHLFVLGAMGVVALELMLLCFWKR